MCKTSASLPWLAHMAWDHEEAFESHVFDNGDIAQLVAASDWLIIHASHVSKVGGSTPPVPVIRISYSQVGTRCWGRSGACPIPTIRSMPV